MDDRRSAKDECDLSPPGAGGRGILAFAASIAAHALVILAIACFAAPVVRPHTEWIILHVGASGIGHDTNPGASGRGAALARLEAPKSNRAKSTRAKPEALARHRIVRAHAHLHKRPPRRALAHKEKPAIPKTAVANVANPPAATNPVRAASDNPARGLAGAKPPSLVGGGASAGTGNGIGGHGLDDRGSGTGAGMVSAYARYGENPAPEYPDEARRRNEQGTVLLRVLVDADGSVERVEVARSSGFDVLDDAARETVLVRWRFVPARASGVAVRSWVRVPIRFALTEADSGL